MPTCIVNLMVVLSGKICQYIVNIKMLDALSFHVGLTKYQVFIVNLMVT